MSKRRKPTTLPAHDGERTYQAGCGRTMTLRHGAADLAYTALAFPECLTCQHLVQPEGETPFCTWRPRDARNPFADLLDLHLPD